MTPFPVEFLSVPNTFPVEFRDMPLLMPPDMLAPNNAAHDWMIASTWRSPAIDGQQVCFRPGRIGADGLWHGFYTDGISIPWYAQPLIRLTPFSMPELGPCIEHDGGYGAQLFPRATCDLRLRAALETVGVSAFRRDLIYKSVDEFGGGVWDAHTPESIALSRQFCQLVNVGAEPVWAD